MSGFQKEMVKPAMVPLANSVSRGSILSSRKDG